MKTPSFLKKNGSPFKSVFLGIIIIWAVFILSSLICAVICFSGDDPTENVGLMSMVSFLAAGSVGAFINTKLFGKAGSAMPLCSSFASAILYLVIALISNGKVSSGALMNLLCFTLVSLFFTFLGKKRKTAQHRR